MVRYQRQLVKTNNQFRTPLFNGILKTISRHALKKAFEKFAYENRPSHYRPKKETKACTGSLTKTLDMIYHVPIQLKGD